MIYNLVEYLKTQLPSETIYTNNEGPNSPDKMVLVKEAGGIIDSRTRFAHPIIQIIARDIDTTGARMLAYNIYDLIGDVFGLVLPAVTVDGELHSSVQLAQISANQGPHPMGADEQGRFIFVNNYRIHYKER